MLGTVITWDSTLFCAPAASTLCALPQATPPPCSLSADLCGSTCIGPSAPKSACAASVWHTGHSQTYLRKGTWACSLGPRRADFTHAQGFRSLAATPCVVWQSTVYTYMNEICVTVTA